MANTRYDVWVHAEDGSHKYAVDMSFEDATKICLDWLGSAYDKVSAYKYVGMYGSVIEIHQWKFASCCDCGEPIYGEPTEFFGEQEHPIHPDCKKSHGATLDSETDDEDDDLDLEDEETIYKCKYCTKPVSIKHGTMGVDGIDDVCVDCLDLPF